MALAGHPVVVYVKATSASAIAGDEIDGINNVSYSPTVDMLEVTDFKDTSGYRQKLAGLRDGSITLSGDLEMADAPQDLLRTAFGDGTSVWATLHFDPGGSAGSKGFKVECKVSANDVSASFDGKVETSFTLDFTAAPAAE